MSGFQPVEEIADRWRELLDVDQEGIVSLVGIQRDELGLRAAPCQALRGDARLPRR